MPVKAPAPERQRLRELGRFHAWVEKPMLALSLLWLGLLVLDFTSGLNAALRGLSDAIWLVFVLEFAIAFALAPRKVEYLRKNWLKALALAAPALRLLRAARSMNALGRAAGMYAFEREFVDTGRPRALPAPRHLRL
jgi:voltage-gated potassium channel